MAEDDKIWERIPGESAKCYNHFCKYRDMPPCRSIRKLASTFKLSRQALEKLSVQFNWVCRVEAYDADLARQVREQNETEIINMRIKHAGIAVQMLEKATEFLNNISNDDISASDVARLVDIGVKIERLSRGESTENTRIDGETKITHTGEVNITGIGGLDLSKLSDEELMKLEDIFSKLQPTDQD